MSFPKFNSIHNQIQANEECRDKISKQNSFKCKHPKTRLNSINSCNQLSHLSGFNHSFANGRIQKQQNLHLSLLEETANTARLNVLIGGLHDLRM